MFAATALIKNVLTKKSGSLCLSHLLNQPGQDLNLERKYQKLLCCQLHHRVFFQKLLIGRVNPIDTKKHHKNMPFKPMDFFISYTTDGGVFLATRCKTSTKICGCGFIRKPKQAAATSPAHSRKFLLQTAGRSMRTKDAIQLE